MTSHILASQILSRLIDRLGQADWHGLGELDRLIIQECCFDAAELQLKVLASGAAPASVAALAREKAHISAQLVNLTTAAGIVVEAALWRAVSSLLVRTGMAVLTGA